MSKAKEEELRRLYEDPSQAGSLGGVRSLIRLAKNKGLDVKEREAKEFLEGHSTYTLHGRVHREKGVLNERIVTSGPFDLWEADLMDMPKGSKAKYLLNVIDAHSKKAWSEPLKTKSPTLVKEAFKKILKARLPPGVTLNGLCTDAGTEFFNKIMKREVYEPNGINHYRAQKPPGASIVEHFNRTLGEKLERYRTTFPQTKDLLPILEKVVEAYNKSWHSMLRSTPNECHDTAYQIALKGADSLLEASNQEITLPEKKNEIVLTYIHTAMGRNKEPHQWDPVAGPKPDDPLKPGNYVRLHRRKNMFEKGRAKNFTDEVFKIVGNAGSNPNAYRLRDEQGEEIIGKIYRRQLQRLSKKPETYEVHILARRHRRGRPSEVRVEWVGHPHLPSQWISTKDLVDV